MNGVILIFANVSRSDATVSVRDAAGQEQFVTQVKAGTSERQAAATGQTWTVVGNENYTITVGDKHTVYLIGSSGVYEVQNPKSLAPDGGDAASDFQLPASGGGSWD